MNRRYFLGRLIGATVAAAAAPFLKFAPGLPVKPVRIVAADPATGISMRFVRHYDLTADMMPTRIDVLYGVASPFHVQRRWWQFWKAA